MSRIRTNTLAVGTSFFVTAIMGFIQVKVLTTAMTQEEVGMWSAVMAVGALLATGSELGLPLVIVRYGAKYDAEGRPARLARLLSFVHRTYLGAVVVMTGMLFVLGPWVARTLGGGALDRWLVILGYWAVASGSIRAFNNAGFRGVRRMAYIAYIEIGFALIVTLGYVLLRKGIHPGLALWVFLGASLFSGILGVVVLHRILSRVPGHDTPAVTAMPIREEIGGYWLGAAGGGVLLIAMEQLDKPILTRFVTFQEIAVFYVAARLALFARRLLYEPFRVMNPEITHKWEGHRREELSADMHLFIKLELALGLGLTVFLAVFAKPLLLLVSTREFLTGAPVLWAFTAMIPLLCLHQPLVMFLRAVGHVWLAVAADALWLGVYISLGSVFLRLYGLPGFVVGQVLASVAVLIAVLIFFHRHGLPRPSVGFFLRRVLLSAGIWGGSVLLGRNLPEMPWWALALVAGVILLLANALLVRGRFFTRDEEQRAVLHLAGRGAAGRVARFLLGWPRGAFLATRRSAS